MLDFLIDSENDIYWGSTLFIYFYFYFIRVCERDDYVEYRLFVFNLQRMISFCLEIKFDVKEGMQVRTHIKRKYSVEMNTKNNIGQWYVSGNTCSELISIYDIYSRKV